MAGHDRNHIYLVTGKDERFVYLADGNVKLLAEPKKKDVYKRQCRISRAASFTRRDRSIFLM